MIDTTELHRIIFAAASQALKKTKLTESAIYGAATEIAKNGSEAMIVFLKLELAALDKTDPMRQYLERNVLEHLTPDHAKL